ncbi:putative endopeptidase p60 precursor [mine drainage metagenome]|uniref:Putative endopeptidase p60 n=1 Tax=mine drainage metagenome TaxID=410659 RepID=A0A1J5QF33_9ZZZZ
MICGIYPVNLNFVSRRTLTLALCAALLLGSSPAVAKTRKPSLAEIAAAKSTEIAKAKVAATAKAKLDAAQVRLRVLAQAAAAAKVAYDQSVTELKTAVQIAQQKAATALLAANAVSQAHDEIGRVAVGAYTMGGGFTNLDALLHAAGPQDLMDRLTQLNVISSSNATLLHRYESAADVAKAAKAAADSAKAAQLAATNKVAAAKKVADAIKANQQSEVDSLMALQNQLMSELAKAHNVTVTLEQQRQLAILEEQRANTASHTRGQAKIWPNRGFTGRQTLRTTPEQRQVALDFAKQEVLAGKPYVWGAQGPRSYDCSGLVYAAFHAAGLRAPEWSRLNAALYFVATQRVPLSQLQPGDLVFWSYNGTVGSIHHIAIYAGNDMVWEARGTKAGLKFSNMYDTDGLMPFGGRV